MSRFAILGSAILTAALTVGCFDKDSDTPSGPRLFTGDPDISSVNEVLGTAVPLANAATLAMAAMRGDNVPCAAVTVQCSSYPCNGSVTVTLDAACALPLGSVGNGAIVVGGTWTSDTSADLTAVFEGVAIDTDSLFVRQGAFAATLKGDTMMVVYADQSVTVSVTRAGIDQSTWTVKTATQGTLGDISDDQMTIFGYRQYVAGASIYQMVLTDVRMNGACTRNPVDGTATVFEWGLPTDFTLLEFHSDCDGNAVVTASIYVQWINDEIALDLLN
jgi:hypothetical protein